MRYLSDVGVELHMDTHYTVPVSVYVLCSHMCLPVKTIMIGERPYSTDIHPRVSSAMSYDPLKSTATPSTVGVARDLMSAEKVGYARTESWARDSWMYLNSGSLVVNCCLFLPFTSSRSLSEIVPFQRWIRQILECSLEMSSDNIDVVCMGIPAFNVIDSMLSSMGKERTKIRKRRYPNPAIWSKPGGDVLSRNGTFGEPASSKAIARAVKRSLSSRPLSYHDYIAEISSTMSSQERKVGDVLTTGQLLVEQIERAYNHIAKDHPVPTLTESYEAFSRAMVEYRDSVIRDLVLHAAAGQENVSSKSGKSTEWGSKKAWNKAPSSVGTSSKMSTVPEQPTGVQQLFESDEEQNPAPTTEPTQTHAPADDVDTEVEQKKQKKRVVKVRRVKKKPSMTLDTPLSDAHQSVLRSCMYYASMTKENSSLQQTITIALEEQRVSHIDVLAILGVADMDRNKLSLEADVSLGMATGEKEETAMLPKVIDKLLALES